MMTISPIFPVLLTNSTMSLPASSSGSVAMAIKRLDWQHEPRPHHPHRWIGARESGSLDRQSAGRDARRIQAGPTQRRAERSLLGDADRRRNASALARREAQA